MEGLLASAWQAAYTGAGLFWKALWALALGYAFASILQVFVARAQVAEHLGKPGLKEIGLGMALGPSSSSCSFAALSAARALLTKDAALIPVLAFLFTSTNLSVEVGALAWIFLGWQFTLALFVGAFALVAVMAGLVILTCPAGLVEQARAHARQAGGEHGATPTDPSEGLPGAWRDRLRSHEAWKRVGSVYIREWKMVWVDLLIGFLVAGAVATCVPDRFFETLFPTNLPPWLLVPVHALLGPVLALLTFIGSMGNGPLAAILWQHGVLFAGIMAFLFADFVVIPSLRINARYYGWKFTAYLAAVFAGSAVAAGIVVHLLFGALGLIPPAQPGRVEQLARFGVDYTLFLNLLALAVAGVLMWLAKRDSQRQQQSATAHGAP
jgi:uncharacterized membrane protein YraQ (UPF0718 family)